MAVPISNVTRRVVFAPSGTGPYAFTFEILAATDIEVYKGDTLLTLTTDYTVTINPNGTGSVTLVLTAGTDNITIVGARAIERTSDFVTGGDFFANTVNTELDSLTIFAQQNAEAVTRSIQAPVTDPTTIDMTLPVKADRANRVLAFDANGNPAPGAPAFPTTLVATEIPRVNAAGTAYELRSQAETRADIGADNASNLTSGTVADGRLPTTMAGKTLTTATLSAPTINNATMTAPALGTPASGTLTNCTGLPISTGVAGLGTNVGTFLATPSSDNLRAALTDETGTGAAVFATSPTLTTPNLGTPSAATLTNATGLPVATGISGLGSGVADFLATPSSANLITAVTDETGTGALVFGTSPTLTTPDIATDAKFKATAAAKFYDTDNSNFVGLKAAGTVSADLTFTLPTADGSAGQFLKTDGSGALSFDTPAGAGDVQGPASSVDNTVPRFDSTTGKVIQTSGVVIDDSDNLTANSIITDTISEETSAAGVTVDGVLLKDSEVTTDVINEKTSAAGVTVDGVLLKDTGVGSAASPVTLNSLAYPTEGSVNFRNRIINGDMRIDQRNAGASVSRSAGSGDAYQLDRWLTANAADAVFTVQQVSDAPTGFINSLKITVTTADASLGSTQINLVRQSIEGLNVYDLAWGSASAKSVTLSFWVKSSLTGQFGGSMTNSAANRTYPFNYTINSADTWEQKSITVSGDTTGTWLTTSGVGIRLDFNIGTGSTYLGTANAWAASNLVGTTGDTSVVGTLNATWQITGVQLEVGNVATPFERRPYGTELALCQRYFVKFGGNVTDEAIGTFGTGASATTSRIYVPLPVSMRAVPSVSSSTLELIDSVNPAIAVTSVAVGSTVTGPLNGFIVATVASGLTTYRPYALRVANSLSGHLSYSAEL